MSNPSKERGTAFETATVAYLRERLGDARIERRALHGSRDLGDVGGIRAHGFEGIAECKRVERMTPALLEEFKRQALAERDNAGADFVLLVVWRRGRGYQCRNGRAPASFGGNVCYMTLGDLLRVADVEPVREGGAACGAWVSMTLADAASLMAGEGVADGRE